jgi:hypothetical protein
MSTDKNGDMKHTTPLTDQQWAAATISSAIFMSTGALLFAAMLIASVGGQAVGPGNEIQEKVFTEVQAKVFGVITLINAVLFYVVGLTIWRKAFRKR